jgi:DNA replication protein DnaC
MDDMENLGSIMRRAMGHPVTPPGDTSGKQHLRIVDAQIVPVGDDQASDDLPGMIQLSSDEGHATPVSLVPQPMRSPHPRKRSAVVQPLTVEQERPALPAPTPQQKEICQICKGAGYLRQDVPFGHPEFGKLKKCQCKIRQQAQALFGGAHIPDDFTAFSFESYQCLPLSPDQRQAAMLVQAFVLPRLDATFAGRKRGLYLYGLWGVGKTGLAVSALRQAIEAGYSGLYLSTAELFDILYEAIAASQRLVRGYGDDEDKAEESAGAKLLRLVEQVQWLVLDDLGVECGSRFVIQKLYRIIEGRRSIRGLYTIFTSNKDAYGLEQHWRPEGPKAVAFDDCIRIIERLGEYCVPMHLKGRSLRERSGGNE